MARFIPIAGAVTGVAILVGAGLYAAISADPDPILLRLAAVAELFGACFAFLSIGAATLV